MECSQTLNRDGYGKEADIPLVNNKVFLSSVIMYKYVKYNQSNERCRAALSCDTVHVGQCICSLARVRMLNEISDC